MNGHTPLKFPDCEAHFAAISRLPYKGLQSQQELT